MWLKGFLKGPQKLDNMCLTLGLVARVGPQGVLCSLFYLFRCLSRFLQDWIWTISHQPCCCSFRLLDMKQLLEVFLPIGHLAHVSHPQQPWEMTHCSFFLLFVIAKRWDCQAWVGQDFPSTQLDCQHQHCSRWQTSLASVLLPSANTGDKVASNWPDFW